MNALFPAFAADCFFDQKEMRRYELKPTNSHPKNITKKFPDITNKSIENTNTLK